MSILNIVTPEEAKNKLCVHGGVDNTSLNCSSTKCMAWVRESKVVIDVEGRPTLPGPRRGEFTPAVQQKSHTELTGKGYCGLVGA